MNKNSNYHYGRIRKYYIGMERQPIAAGDFVKQHGDVFFQIVRDCFASLTKEQYTVLCGYYSSDVNMELAELNAIFEDRERATQVLVCNMLLFELLYDLLLFEKYKDTTHFLAIFGKYMKHLSGDPGEPFSEWLAGVRKECADLDAEDETTILLKLLAAVQFVLLHEFAHLQEDLQESAVRMFMETDKVKEQIKDFTDAQIKEAACDFNAMFTLSSALLSVGKTIDDTTECSATDLLTYGFILLNAAPILDLLKICFSLGTDNNIDMESLSDELNGQLLTRSAPLVVCALLTQNTESMKAENLDVKEAFSRAHTLIQDFLSCTGKALQIMAAKIAEIESSGAGPVMLTLNDPISAEEIWFRVS